MINGSVESQKRSNINSMPRTLITGLNGCILKNLLINVTASADSQIVISCPMSSYQSSKNVIYKSTRFICPAGKIVLISPDSNNTKKDFYSLGLFFLFVSDMSTKLLHFRRCVQIRCQNAKQMHTMSCRSRMQYGNNSCQR